MRAVVQSIGYDLMLGDEHEATADLEEIQRARMSSLKQRLWASIALSTPLVVIGMFMMHEPWANFVMWALSTPVVLSSAAPSSSTHGSRRSTAARTWTRWSP
jgi:Cu2+-exporting ATPase